MKKKVVLVLFSVMILLTGCCLSHEWVEASCMAPKTCTKCGETEGEIMEHTWLEATCTTPKTCSVCNTTEGENLEHTWVEATCSAPKKCSICNMSEGEELEHVLTEATYQHGPACEVCGEVIGEPIQPSASIEQIEELQERIDALVVAYDAGNHDAINTMGEYVAKTNDEMLAGKDEYVENMNKYYGVEFDWTRWLGVIPMTFHLSINTQLSDMPEFDDCVVNTSAASVSNYIFFVQADTSNAMTGGIMLFNSMPYIKEIATGSPIVLDVIYYDEQQPVNNMIVKTIGHGIIQANNKTFFAELAGDGSIINIYAEDSGKFFRPNKESVETGVYDGEIKEISVTGDVEYWQDEEGVWWFASENIGATITATYDGYDGCYKLIQGEEDEETGSFPKSGAEVYEEWYGK